MTSFVKRINRFFNKSESTAFASMFIAVAVMLSKLMGFVRDMIIARYFGATYATDAYLIAYMFPGIIFSMLAVALGTSFLPIFTELNSKGKTKDAWALAANVLVLLGLSLILFIVIGEVIAPYIIPLMAPGFNEETRQLAITLTRIVFPSLVFSVMNGLFNSILNSYRMFSLSAINGIVLNTAYILCIVIFAHALGIKALAVGALVGFALQCLYLIPSVLRLGKFDLRQLSWKNDHFRKVIRNMIPVVLSLTVHQIHIIVDRIMASGLAEGSVSSLDYANKLVSLPNQVFVAALATALFPTLSQMAAEEHTAEARNLLARALRLTAVLIVPVSIGMIILRVPIVGLAFERGAFTSEATRQTSTALAWYGIGLLGVSFTTLLTKAFYALQDTKTPVIISLFSIPLNIVLNLILVGPMGHGGLALGTSIAVLIQASALFIFLGKRLPNKDAQSSHSFTVRVFFASLPMSLAVYASYWGLCRLFPMISSFSYAVKLFIPTLIGIAVYLLMCFKLKIREAKDLLLKVKLLIQKKINLKKTSRQTPNFSSAADKKGI